MGDVATVSMIRRYCDGELPAAEAEAFEMQLRESPELQQRVKAERRLREHVASALQQGWVTPDTLAERIRTALDAAPTSVGPVETPRRAWWRSPSRANVFAVAASIMLVTSAVLVGILLPPIDTWRGAPDVAAAAAAAVASEHNRNAFGPRFEEMEFRTEGSAAAGLAAELGPSGIIDLHGLGYDFVGASHCRVPHCPSGCHLYYHRTDGREGFASLHIVPDTGQFSLHRRPELDLLPLATDVVPRDRECPKDVLVWRHDGRCYLLVACIPDDLAPVADRVQAALLDDR